MIKIDSLTKTFENLNRSINVFESFDLDIAYGSTTVILGPSGCGKTTLLRMISGLEAPTAGSISFTSSEHKIGMVFQEYTAFPWLTVAQNIEFGLKLANLPADYIRKQIDYWIGKVELTKARDLYPHQISGGMKQRLAISRCLALEPDILLMDEPFGALDAITRSKMVDFTGRLLDELEVTCVLVTHNVREAIQLADRIVTLPLPPIHKTSKAFDVNVERLPYEKRVDNPQAVRLELELLNTLKQEWPCR